MFKSDLHVGRAGEYLVAAQLLSMGFDVSMAEQGMPYDLIADVNGRLLRVQVKSTRKASPVPGRKDQEAYIYRISRCGKKGSGSYIGAVDIIAIVAIDAKAVGFISANKMPTTLLVRPESRRGEHQDEINARVNNEILARLNDGVPRSDIVKEFNTSLQRISKIKCDRTKMDTFGVYMADLSLDKALVAMNDLSPEKISGKKPKSRNTPLVT